MVGVVVTRDGGPPKSPHGRHMACLNTLKQEIRTLESIFSKNHERFQILSASVDELSCRFIAKNGKKYEIHANITVSKALVMSTSTRHGLCNPVNCARPVGLGNNC